MVKDRQADLGFQGTEMTQEGGVSLGGREKGTFNKGERCMCLFWPNLKVCKKGTCPYFERLECHGQEF